MLSVLSVAAGAAVGAIVRWIVSGVLNSSDSTIQAGTLCVNLAGGFLIGLAVKFFDAMSSLPPEFRLATITGLLGALTTFSTFSLEAVGLIRSEKYIALVSMIALHVVGSIVAVFLGMELGKRLV